MPAPPFRTIEFLKSAPAPKFFPRADLPEVAFAGRSNVGKSSLLNALCNRRQLARTSKSPGRTREINFFTVDDVYRLVDLPGYGFSKAPKQVSGNWAKLMETYIAERANLMGVIVLIDSRHEPTALDCQMIEYLQAMEVPFVIVLTKVDKLSRGALARQVKLVERRFADASVLATSASKKQGLDEVWDLIHQAVGLAGETVDDG